MSWELVSSLHLIKESSTFSHSTTNETFKLTRRPLNYNSKHDAYLIECKVCVSRFRYIGVLKQFLLSAITIIRVRVFV